jgi:EAL domain-containing protein (putative c-di-GMP-specific phosphodiesterase class I)
VIGQSVRRCGRLPASYLKLDRSYVAGITEDQTDEAIVRAAVTLGRAFDMRVVAEGVERPAVLDAVRRLECDFVQGFLVARPMAAAALREWVDGR